MTFGDQLRSIAGEFAAARLEPFKGHPLAYLIRREWPETLKAALGEERARRYRFDASPGLGQWSEAPWLAVMSPAITVSAMVGVYPVYLFEPGFKTVCLVMGQGTQRLEEAVGRKRAAGELIKRAALIRKRGGPWEKAGFSIGPFNTLKSVAIVRDADQISDPWASTAAFGIRYEIDNLPNDTVMAAHLSSMLDLYDQMISNGSLIFTKIDDELLELRDSGELPTGTIDGAKEVVEHRKFERRTRNSKLIADVKKRLGSTCQACKFSFGHFYGAHMAGFIEAHHIVPISSLGDVGAVLKPDANDFMVLCSNCHRAIHRAGCPDLNTFIAALPITRNI